MILKPKTDEIDILKQELKQVKQELDETKKVSTPNFNRYLLVTKLVKTMHFSASCFSF